MRSSRTCAVVASLILLAAGCGRPGNGPANWTLTVKPARTATTLDTRVEELACAGGRSDAGRIEKPRVAYSATSITITFHVKRLAGSQMCQARKDTAAAYTVKLSEPIGARHLYNGRTTPPILVR